MIDDAGAEGPPSRSSGTVRAAGAPPLRLDELARELPLPAQVVGDASRAIHGVSPSSSLPVTM